MATTLQIPAFGRRHAHQLAWIIVAGRKRIPCKVIFTSEEAALLECTPPTWLPFRFELQIQGQPTIRICETKRIVGWGVEVYFVDPEPAAQRSSASSDIFDVGAWSGPGSTKRR
jgi:hypothetical protein